MAKEGELELDELLSVLGNPLRRKILARVAKETHYPLQLSKELGVSQQAIMKHLRILRRYHLVRVCERKSTSMGPPRKCFESTGQFSIRIDFGPSDFETRLFPSEGAVPEGRRGPGRHGPDAEGPEGSLSERLGEARQLEQPGERLLALKDLVMDLNGEIEELERRRMSLTALKQEVLREASTRLYRQLLQEQP